MVIVILRAMHFSGVWGGGSMLFFVLFQEMCVFFPSQSTHWCDWVGSSSAAYLSGKPKLRRLQFAI